MYATRGFAIALVATLFAGTLVAQAAPDSGTRVRVYDVTHHQAVATGTFVRATRDTVVLADATGATWAVPLGAGRTWQVSGGRHRHVLAGMGIGLLAGATVGAVVGLVAGSGDSWYGPGDYAAAGAIVFSVPGALIGTLAGMGKTEKWQRVGPVVAGVAVAPIGARSAAVRVSFRF